MRAKILFVALAIILLHSALSSRAQNNPNLENGLVPFGTYDAG